MSFKEFPTNPGAFPREPQSIMLAGIEYEADSPLARDLAQLVMIASLITDEERSRFDTEVPEDFRHVTNTSFFVANPWYIEQRILREAGHPIVLVGPEADRDRMIRRPGQLAVYAQADYRPLCAISRPHQDESPVRYFLQEVLRDQRYPFTQALTGEMDDIYPKFAATDIGLKQRAFMLGVLVAGMKELLEDSDKPDTELSLQRLHRKSLRMYEQLAEAGVTPLGLEEINGIIRSDVQRRLRGDLRNLPSIAAA